MIKCCTNSHISSADTPLYTILSILLPVFFQRIPIAGLSRMYDDHLFTVHIPRKSPPFFSWANFLSTSSQISDHPAYSLFLAFKRFLSFKSSFLQIVSSWSSTVVILSQTPSTLFSSPFAELPGKTSPLMNATLCSLNSRWRKLQTNYTVGWLALTLTEWS